MIFVLQHLHMEGKRHKSVDDRTLSGFKPPSKGEQIALLVCPSGACDCEGSRLKAYKLLSLFLGIPSARIASEFYSRPRFRPNALHSTYRQSGLSKKINLYRAIRCKNAVLLH